VIINKKQLNLAEPTEHRSGFPKNQHLSRDARYQHFALKKRAEHWLVKNILYTVCVQIQPLEKMLTLLWVSFENSQNCTQITATPHGSTSMLANTSKCHVQQQLIKPIS
jgi:hypothetical protein